MEKNTFLNQDEKIGALEALLFYYGEPLTIKKISTLLEETEENVKILIQKLEEKLHNNQSGGLQIIYYNDKVELVTKPQFNFIIKKIINDEFKAELTPAALETLAIIAYLGPATRAQIDYLRGVNSTFILRNLLIRGLIERKLQVDKKNTYEYSITSEFLKHLGIESVLNLPEYEKYSKILSKFESKINQEIQNTNKNEIQMGEIAEENQG